MIHESLPFYRAIAEKTESDTPRLIYADWLEEQGAASRAEYIRLQCQRAAGDPFDPKTHWRRSKERKLLHEFAPKWFGSQQGKLMRRSYSRGFIKYAEVLSTHLANEPDGLFRFGPIEWLHVVATNTAAAHIHEIVGLPHLSCIAHLELLSCGLRPADIIELANSPFVGNLRSLDLSGNAIGEEGVDALLHSTRFERLETLTLTDCGISNASIRSWAEAPGFPRLRVVGAQLESGEILNIECHPAKLVE